MLLRMHWRSYWPVPKTFRTTEGASTTLNSFSQLQFASQVHGMHVISRRNTHLYIFYQRSRTQRALGGSLHVALFFKQKTTSTQLKHLSACFRHRRTSSPKVGDQLVHGEMNIETWRNLSSKYLANLTGV